MNQSLRFIQCSSHKFDSCLLDNILYKLETAICFCFLSVGCTFFRQFWEFVPVLSNFKLWCPTGLSPRPYFIFTACMSFCLSFPQTQIFFSSYLLMTYSCQTTPPVERIIIFTLAYYCGIMSHSCAAFGEGIVGGLWVCRLKPRQTKRINRKEV